jgi:subtilase family serine protease
MRMGKRALLLFTVVLAMMAACAGVVLAQPTAPSGQEQSTPPSPGENASDNAPVCPGPASQGHARCHAIKHNASQKASATPPSGSLGPADLQSAYNLKGLAGTAGTGKTVAIVDAYNNPTAFSDLDGYRDQYGLAGMTDATGTSTTPGSSASGPPTFWKVDQTGGNNYPSGTSWSTEIALDIEAVSAICPNCNILLVEAKSNSFDDLGAAVKYAAGLPGVVAISNSYGTSGEFSTEASYDKYYNFPNIAVTASSGDSGYGAIYPAASPSVIAVGGTSLTKATNARGWTETAWRGAGSGCSTVEPKPNWQSSYCSGGKRAVADVSAVADPNTGLAVLDTTGSGGWIQVGGTSASSPVIAAVYALGGNYSSTTPAGKWLYQHVTYNQTLWDVTSGSNTKRKCTPSLICKSATGYDGPTGLGTPDGGGAF